MRAISKGSWKIIVWSSSLVAVLMGYCIAVSPLVGSRHSFFSVTDLITPLTGLFGLGFIGIAAAVRLIVFNSSAFSFMALVYHLPGICGAIAFKRSTFLVRVLLPGACMIAFSVHPIGRFAIPYTFYWLIPIFLYLFKRHSLFETALACTFVTHAVGSVSWLYGKQLAVGVWWSLLPVVFFERLLSALMMTGIYYVVVRMGKLIRSSQLYKKSFVPFKNQN